MATLFKKLTESAQKVASTAQKAVEATGAAISDVSEGLGAKVSEWNDERTQRELAKAEKKSREEEISSGLYVEDGKIIIGTLDGMCRWFEGLTGKVSGPYSEVVKAQVLILSVINSPVMVRVPIDRLMNMLNRALEASADDVQKADVKDAFASMLQNLFSFLSLKVNYLTDRKNDEAGELARQAGEDLADCIRGIAAVFATDSGTVVEVRNPLATAQAQADFLKKTLSMAKDNSDILKKTNDYKDNLQDTFNLFDIYSSVIGPSILFHGLLSKCRRVLVEIRKAELIAPIRKKYSSMATEKAIKTIGKAFMPDSIKDLTNPAGYALKTAFHAASGIGNVISEFQESRASLAEAERQLNELDCSIPEVNAVKKEIEAYDKTLQEIENKYIVSLRVDQLSK